MHGRHVRVGLRTANLTDPARGVKCRYPCCRNLTLARSELVRRPRYGGRVSADLFSKNPVTGFPCQYCLVQWHRSRPRPRNVNNDLRTRGTVSRLICFSFALSDVLLQCLTRAHHDRETKTLTYRPIPETKSDQRSDNGSQEAKANARGQAVARAADDM